MVGAEGGLGAPGQPGGPPPPPLVARGVFGPRLSLAERYVSALATDGVVRGLIGPREVPRLWERHLLNCAVIGELVPEGCHVLDVGAGAGLPGIALTLARPDLTVTLLEPLARRVAFLEEMVLQLRLARVNVVRGRAEEWGSRPPPDLVIARAVAPLDRLAQWCLPLLAPGGRLLAIKGASAAAEVQRCAPAVHRAGGRDAQVRMCGVGVVVPAATVVEVTKSVAVARRRSKG